jgi:tetratricopeptide (TPR) repeat protein/energy-coupling factor transporter ATP-binding protein EcfA2
VATQPTDAIEVFYSYSHKDEKLREKLEEHLAQLKRENVINDWHDRKLSGGSEWAGQIDEHLEAADIILLLVSSSFLASAYCNDVEVKQAMARHEADEARVIPIILRPCDWTTAPFSKLQGFPEDAKPITLWPNRDEAFLDVAKGIRATAKELLASRATQPTKPDETANSISSLPIPRPPVVGFVARRDEQGRNIVELLKAELAPQQNRLVTLSGPGGAGKTTLAAEGVRALQNVFAGRIVWSSAAGRAGYTLSTLLDDVATQLGRADLRALAPEAKEAEVRALVADPPSLVVVDNYETVAVAEQPRIEAWFERTQCATLFTSRQKIKQTRNITIQFMQPDEAEELLLRLIAQTQDPQLFSAEVRRQIYETAEANPFLMEWIVAQIDEAQEPRTVLAELAQGEGDAAERVFDRSFNLEQVGDDGRAALLALSLFVPSARRAALAEVAGFGDDERRLNDAVKNLRSLWLIKGLDENRRLTIEGLTHSLAEAHLAKDERSNEFRQRFVTHFLRHAEAHKQPTPKAYDALEAEKDNLVAAMDIAEGLSDWQSISQLALVIAAPYVGVLSVRGYWDELIRRGDQGARAAEVTGDEWMAVILSGNAAAIRMERGEYEAAQQAYDQALEVSRRLGDEAGVAVILHQLGRLAQAQGKPDEARRLYGESLEISESLGDQRNSAYTLGQLGTIAHDQGEWAEAQRYYEKTLEISQALGDQYSISTALHQLAMLAEDQGEFGEAWRLYEESLEIKQKLGDQIGIALTLHNLGLLTEKEGDKAEAARLLREALSIFERLKSPDAEKARRILARVEAE